MYDIKLKTRLFPQLPIVRMIVLNEASSLLVVSTLWYKIPKVFYLVTNNLNILRLAWLIRDLLIAERTELFSLSNNQLLMLH